MKKNNILFYIIIFLFSYLKYNVFQNKKDNKENNKKKYNN